MVPVIKPVQVKYKTVHPLKGGVHFTLNGEEKKSANGFILPQNNTERNIATERIQKLLGIYERGCRWNKIAAQNQQGNHTKKAEQQDDNRTWKKSGINEKRKRKYPPRHGSQTYRAYS